MAHAPSVAVPTVSVPLLASTATHAAEPVSVTSPGVSSLASATVTRGGLSLRLRFLASPAQWQSAARPAATHAATGLKVSVWKTMRVPSMPKTSTSMVWAEVQCCSGKTPEVPNSSRCPGVRAPSDTDAMAYTLALAGSGCTPSTATATENEGGGSMCTESVAVMAERACVAPICRLSIAATDAHEAVAEPTTFMSPRAPSVWTPPETHGLGNVTERATGFQCARGAAETTSESGSCAGSGTARREETVQPHSVLSSAALHAAGSPRQPASPADDALPTKMPMHTPPRVAASEVTTAARTSPAERASTPGVRVSCDCPAERTTT